MIKVDVFSILLTVFSKSVSRGKLEVRGYLKAPKAMRGICEVTGHQGDK